MIKGSELITLHEDDVLERARDIITKNRFSFLPVTDDRGKCTGKITALRIAGLTEEIINFDYGREVTFKLHTFIKSVGGEITSGESILSSFTGKLFINGISDKRLLTNPETFIFISHYDENVIVDMMRRGVSVVVVCGLSTMDRGIVELARKKGVVLVASPKDILSSVIHLFLTMPIKDFVDREHPTFKHYERVRSVKKEIVKYNEGGFCVLDDNGFLKGVITRINY